MDEKHKHILKRAAMIAIFRGGDVTTDDGVFATTDVDELIYLEEELEDAFGIDMQPSNRKEILAAIDKL